MSFEAVQLVLNRALNDASFRAALLAEPERALGGYALTADEAAALRGLGGAQPPEADPSTWALDAGGDAATPPTDDAERPVVPDRDLARVALFARLPAGALAPFAPYMRRRAYAGGAVLLRQGERAEALHVLVRGRVVVRRGEPARDLARLGPGAVVGEIGILAGTPRTATVAAEEPTATIEISAEGVRALLDAHPEVMEPLLALYRERVDALDD